MKVLVIQPKVGMGDMVIYLPYIHAISKKFHSPVSILVKENSRAKDLLIDDDQIREIIILDRTSMNSGSHDGISGFFRLIKKLKERRFDKVFIFSSSLRYFLASKFAGIKKIAQYPLFRKKDNIVTSAKIFTEHELGTIISTQPKLFLTSSDVDKLRNFNINYCHLCKEKGVFITNCQLFIDENYCNTDKSYRHNDRIKYICEFHKEKGLLKF